MMYPPLTYLLGAKEEDIPHIYLLHPTTETVTTYPEKLDDINKFSPELIMAWAEKTVIEWEIESYEHQLDQTYTDEETGEERDYLDQDGKDYVRGAIEHEKERLKEKTKEYDDILAELSHTNEFAENVDDHLEVADLHMIRIEQAYMEEL